MCGTEAAWGPVDGFIFNQQLDVQGGTEVDIGPCVLLDASTLAEVRMTCLSTPGCVAFSVMGLRNYDYYDYLGRGAVYCLKSSGGPLQYQGHTWMREACMGTYVAIGKTTSTISTTG